MNKNILTILFLVFFFSADCQTPVAYWPFNNSPADQSGNHNDGVIHGNVTPAMDRYGNPCGAYHFDGASGFIEVPSSASLESPSGNITITVWYLLDKAKDYRWLTALCKGSGKGESPDNPQYRLQVQQNTVVAVNTCSPYIPSASSTVSVNTEFTECDMNFQAHMFEAGKWGFYALVYDGQKVITYLNGRRVFEFSYSGILTRNSAPLYIGFDEPGNAEYFEGSLDDINVFNVALTDRQILDLFNEANNTDWSKEEFEITTPENKVINLPERACTVPVNFNPPQLIRSGCSNVSIRQIEGLPSGSNFQSGRHLITYAAVSASGYEERSSFYIIVKDVTVPELRVPRDTVIEIKKGTNGIKYSYKRPDATDNCGVKSVDLLSGKASNDFFSVGRHTIKYRATDINNNISEKEFNVDIREEIVIAPVVPPIIPPTVPVTIDTTKRTPAIPLVLPPKDTVIPKPPVVPKVDTIVPPPVTVPVNTDSIPADFDKRTKKEQRFIETESSILIAKLYDNGVNDGDTVSIFLNQKPLLWKSLVSSKGQEFTIQIDTTKDNELVMYAENLGKIPPNTALLILYDGTIRHEINLLSNMETSGAIRLRRKKK